MLTSPLINAKARIQLALEFVQSRWMSSHQQGEDAGAGEDEDPFINQQVATSRHRA
jgi:hypothetical protein